MRSLEPASRSRRRTTMLSSSRVVVACVSLVVLVAGACGQDDTTVTAGPPPPFTLYVSNQSFEDSTVAITISIDDVVVVDQNFDVEGQHNWISFEPDIPPGEHVLHAVSDTGVEFTSDFTIPEGEPRWAVIDYWFYPDEGPRNFTFSISDEPIGFD